MANKPKPRTDKAARKRAAEGKRSSHRSRPSTKTTEKWSQRVTEVSHALVLEEGVFTLSDPVEIAASLRRSAQASHEHKVEPFRSALSMLTFYINRAGRNLTPERRAILMQAKDELRKLYGRTP
jgi:hypothetical protein